jgi:hypothetical protein
MLIPLFGIEIDFIFFGEEPNLFVNYFVKIEVDGYHKIVIMPNIGQNRLKCINQFFLFGHIS